MSFCNSVSGRRANISPDEKGSAEAVKLWDDRIKPLLKSFDKVFDDLAKDIVSLYLNDKNLPQDALWKKLGGNLLVNVLSIIEELLKTIMSLVAKVVLLVKNFGNLK